MENLRFYNYDKGIEKRIIEVLDSIPRSLTEIASLSKTQRITASKHLNRLVKCGIAIEYRKPRMRLFVKRKVPVKSNFRGEYCDIR